MLKRIFFFLFGIVAVLAGLVALSYALDGIGYFTLSKGQWLGAAVGFLVPAVLSASAFYMAVRLFKSSRASGEPHISEPE
ncbi:MAG TPA: hypothetical protein VEU31_11080 [Candidatus Acidoferrales bacterium]|nr:hypothetical protein [Candidatus Acidoferrales bacterium]